MFLFLFLILDLYFLIPAIIAQAFNPTAELAMPIETQKLKKQKQKLNPIQ